MTPEQEQNLLELLAGIANELHRLADKLAPVKPERPKHTAVLGTATYSVEERERIALRKALKGEKPKSPPAGA